VDVSDDEQGSMESKEIGLIFFLSRIILRMVEILRTMQVISLRFNCPYFLSLDTI
jgi:hypothetical protein